MSRLYTQCILAITTVSTGFLGCEAPVTVEQGPHIQLMPTQPFPPSNASHADTVDALRGRLLDSYTLYWPLIDSAYQHDQLPYVLNDPLPELRAFGIGRVAVLLRDGDATDEELQLVVDRLRDPSPSVRLAAAKLLPEINTPGLAEFVANSLQAENDPQVIEEELLFFRARPDIKAIRPVIDLLEQNNSAASETLVVLLQSHDVSLETKSQIVQIAQKVRRKNESPQLITLVAMLGSDSDKNKLIRLLDHEDDSIKQAVAEGFASSGYAMPLISRAENVEFYEYALAALQVQTGIEAFQELLRLYLPANTTWDNVAFMLATTLDTATLLKADDMLKRLDKDALRLRIWTAVWEKSSDKSLKAKKAIARKTVPLMISKGDAVGALQLLDVFGEALVDDDLLSLRFSAAISASAWDAAADARPMPGPWILAWLTLKETDPTAAAVIRQQITTRFESQLDSNQRKVLGLQQTEVPENNP